MSTPSSPVPDVSPRFPIHKRRLRFLGLTVDDCIKSFFGGNALISVVVLGLITIFLVKEGAGFLGQNRQNLAIYRLAGLEYVDHLRRQSEDHTALTRYLSDLRLRSLNHLTGPGGLTLEAANAKLAPFDDFAARFGDAADPLRGMVSDLSEVATAIKTKFLVNEDKKEERRQLLAEGKSAEAGAVVITAVDFPAELKPLRDSLPAYREANREFAGRLGALLAAPPAMPSAELQQRMERFTALGREFTAAFPAIERDLAAWDHTRPVSGAEAFTAFVFGRQWLTASFWQDWYGVVPLLTGSFLVALVALVIAVPFGVGAGSLALGATKWQTIWRNVLPYALPGILTSSILGIARVAGETAPIMFTAAYVVRDKLPWDVERASDFLFQGVMALPYHIYVVSSKIPQNEFTERVQYGTAFVFLLIVALIATSSILLRNRLRARYKW